MFFTYPSRHVQLKNGIALCILFCNFYLLFLSLVYLEALSMSVHGNLLNSFQLLHRIPVLLWGYTILYLNNSLWMDLDGFQFLLKRILP